MLSPPRATIVDPQGRDRRWGEYNGDPPHTFANVYLHMIFTICRHYRAGMPCVWGMPISEIRLWYHGIRGILTAAGSRG